MISAPLTAIFAEWGTSETVALVVSHSEAVPAFGARAGS
jgi:hypothetical protein